MTNSLLNFYRNNKIAVWLTLGLFLIFFMQKVVQHAAFQSNYYDLIYFDHATWNLSQGRGHWVSSLAFNHMGVHSYVIFYVLSLFYHIVPSPVWMYGLHAFAVACSALPVMAIGRDKLGTKGIWLGLGLLLLNYGFRRANLHDMHGEVLMMPLMAWCVYGLLYRRNWLVWLTVLLLPWTKENAGTLVLMIGFYQAVINRQIKQGIGIMAYGLATTFFLIKLFIPHFRIGDYKFFAQQYGYLGQTPLEQIRTILLHPQVWLSGIFRSEKIGYVLLIFLPLGLLPLLSPLLLLTVGIFAQNLLSNQLNMVDISQYYYYPVIPVLVIAAILGLSRLRQATDWQRYVRRFAIGWIVFFAGVNVLASALMDFRPFAGILTRHVQDSRQILALIPPTASVTASTHYMAHLLYRPTFTLFPEKAVSGDYVMVEDVDPFWPIHGDHGAFVKAQWSTGHKWEVVKAVFRGEMGYSPANREEYAAALTALKRNPSYTLIAKGDRVLLFKRCSGKEEALIPGNSEIRKRT